MGNRKNELIEEIGRLLEEFQKEIPGKRRQWPESIKKRVLELHELGINFTRIAEATTLPYFTLLKWHSERKKAGFELVNVVSTPNSPDAVTVSNAVTAIRGVATVTESNTVTDESTVTLTISGGIRIEGVSFDFLMRLLPVLQEGAQ